MIDGKAMLNDVALLCYCIAIFIVLYYNMLSASDQYETYEYHRNPNYESAYVEYDSSNNE